jgi:hypothetical protein
MMLTEEVRTSQQWGSIAYAATCVIEKCEKTFLLLLKSDRRRAYEKARRMCDDKYAKAKGTMYVSARAICKATVAVRFAK